MAGRSALCSALLAAAAAGLAVAPVEAHADSIRCSGGIVSVGDSKIDLLGKCGQPALREIRHGERSRFVYGLQSAGGRRVDVSVETWSYDFGPRQFIQIVTLENGRVAAIERGSYGYASGGAQGPRGVPVSTCDPAVLDEGDTKLDVLAQCGEPATADEWEEERGYAVFDPGAAVAAGGSFTILREVWTYNFGPRRFVRLVHFENGKVTRVDTGGYGYGG
jgi:hypothetical protein